MELAGTRREANSGAPHTSGDEAELFLNDKSLGRKKKQPGQDFRLVWDDVKYEPGTIKAVAYKDGKEWASDTVTTTGPAAALELASDRYDICGDGLDLAFVTVRIADSKGTTVPRSNPLVKFSISGPGEILAADNGDAASFEPFQASQRQAFNGFALVIVRSKPGSNGTIQLTAKSDGLKSAQIPLSVKRSKAPAARMRP